VDPLDQSLGDWATVLEILRDELEGSFVVQQFPYIVGVGAGDRLAFEELLGLVQSQARPLDARGVVRFEDQSASFILPQPILGQRRALQKSACPLDAGQPGGEKVKRRQPGVRVPGKERAHLFRVFPSNVRIEDRDVGFFSRQP